MPNLLEQSIFNTIRYFDLFDLPVTATQIWRCSILPEQARRVRWAGQRSYSLQTVQQTLAASPWLAGKINRQWGYYVLAGRPAAIRRRLARHVLAQHKWKIARSLARWLARMPFVRMIAGSGSLALDNTRPESDLDVLLIVRSGRMWTARLFAIFVTQLTGQRRTHWDRLAPDKICLNHYLADQPMVIPPAIRNLYTAVAYSHLVPLAGQAVYYRFRQLNASWIRQYLMFPPASSLPHQYHIQLSPLGRWLKAAVEALLAEPVGDWLETAARRWQLQLINRHRDPRKGGRVAISATELAFHPDSKVEGILQQFSQDSFQQRFVL